jgi:hypothetical protein
MNFLECALDPFHDTEIRLPGYPDISSARSLTQVVQLQATINNPFTGTGAWDIHCFFVPTTGDSSAVDNSLGQKVYYSNGAYNPVSPVVYGPTAIFAGLNIIAVPTGLNWRTAPTSSVVSLAKNLTVPQTYVRGRHRLLGCGYEIVDVSADLYKAGSVTCYKSPTQSIQRTLTDGASRTAGHFGIQPLPPSSLAEANLYVNAKTWAGRDGCYCIVSQNDVSNPVVSTVPGNFAAFDDSDYTPSVTTAVGFGTFVDDAALSSTYPFDNVGAIFSGANAQSTYTITVRYLFERFPTDNEPDLVVLSQPSAPYDPLALEIYARCLDQLPSYVPVGENPLGEWFSKILSTVGKVAPLIGKVLPFPGATIIGEGIGSVASGVSQYLEPSNSNGKRRNKKPAPAIPPKGNRMRKPKPPPVPPKPAHLRGRAL